MSSGGESSGGGVAYVPSSLHARVAYVKSKAKQSFSPWAVANRNHHLDLNSDRARGLLRECDSFLSTLEMIQVSPELRVQAKLDEVIKLAFAYQDKHKFPENLARRAETLYKRWVENEWGAVEAAAMDESDDSDPEKPEVRKPTHVSNDPTSRPTSARQPPSNHPIYGVGKIMDGVLFARGPTGRANYVLNSLARDRSHDHRVFGANGLEPGLWFPNMLSANFHGAHGAWQSGISGTMQAGARSVVVGKLYEGLDRDLGHTVYYSGSGYTKRDDEDKDKAKSTAATKSLLTSLHTRRPVRLLRKEGRSKYGPSVGVRYDGLYEVIEARQVKHPKHGVYEQFKLSRCDGQTPLEDYYRSSPTREEVALAELVKHGYN